MELKQGKIIGIVGEEGLSRFVYSLFDERDLERTALVSVDHFFRKETPPSVISRFFSCYSPRWDEERFYHFLERYPVEECELLLPLAVAVGRSVSVVICHPSVGFEGWSALSDPLLGFAEEDGAVVVTSEAVTLLGGFCHEIGYLKEGELVFSEEKELLLGQYGRVSCPRTSLHLVHREDYLRLKLEEHSATLLVECRDQFNGRYPELRAEPTTLEQIFLLLTQGVVS